MWSLILLAVNTIMNVSVKYDFAEEIEVILRARRQAVDLDHTTSGSWSPAVVTFSTNPVMKYDI